MVRLAGLQFAPGKGGPQGRNLRAPKEATAKLVYISKETHYSIEVCCDESQIE